MLVTNCKCNNQIAVNLGIFGSDDSIRPSISDLCGFGVQKNRLFPLIIVLHLIFETTHPIDAEKMFLYWLCELRATSFEVCGLWQENRQKPPEIEITPNEAVERFLKNHSTFKQYEDRLLEVAEEKRPIQVDKQKWANLVTPPKKD